MADTKISGLSAVTSLTSTDEMVLARAGTTKKIDALYLPGFEIAYAELTSHVTVSATSEASPTNVVSAGAVTFDGSTRVKIEFFAPRVDIANTGGAFVIVNLWDDTTTDLGRICVAQTQSLFLPLYGVRFLTPAAATKTYRIRAWRVNGDAVITASTGGGGAGLEEVPAFIRITKA